MTIENETSKKSGYRAEKRTQPEHIEVTIERGLALRFRAALAFADLSLEQGVVAAIETWLTANEDPDLRGVTPLDCTLGAATHIDGRTGEVTVTPAPTCNGGEAPAVTDRGEDLLEAEDREVDAMIAAEEAHDRGALS